MNMITDKFGILSICLHMTLYQLNTKSLYTHNEFRSARCIDDFAIYISELQIYCMKRYFGYRQSQQNDLAVFYIRQSINIPKIEIKNRKVIVKTCYG